MATTSTSRATALIATLVAVCAAVVTTAEASPFAVVARPTPVTAGLEWTAWSSYRDGHYELLTRDPGGVISPLPIQARTVPFDADLGTDSRGRPVITYSRCSVEPRPVRDATTSLPMWVAGRGCDIYEFELSLHRERRLRAVSSATASEVLPSRDGRHLAFVRVRRRTAGTPYRPVIMAGTIGHAMRPLTGGPRGSGSGLPGPTGLDLHGPRLAFSWGWRSPRNPDFRDTEIAVDELSGRQTYRAAAGHGEEAVVEFHSPALDNGTLFYAEVGIDTANLVHRVDLATHHDVSVPAPLYLVGLAAWNGQLTTDVAPGDVTSGPSPTCQSGEQTGCTIEQRPWVADGP